jgi:hypothetical protein
MSPPWGGPQYIRDEVYDAAKSLAAFGGLRGLVTAALGAVRAPALNASQHVTDRLDVELSVPRVSSGAASISADAMAPAADISRQMAGHRTRGVAVFLPRQTDLQQLSAAAPEGMTVEVERAVLDGFVKGITVYFWLEHV